MTTINPFKRRRQKRAREAETRAFLEAYDARRKPIVDKYHRLILEETERYKALIDPISKEHQAKISKLFEDEMAEMKAIEAPTNQDIAETFNN